MLNGTIKHFYHTMLLARLSIKEARSCGKMREVGILGIVVISLFFAKKKTKQKQLELFK